MAQQKQEQDLNQLLKVRRDKLADLQANGKTHFRSQSLTRLITQWK